MVAQDSAGRAVSDSRLPTAVSRIPLPPPQSVSSTQVQDKLSEYRVENRLLGQVIKDLQAELKQKDSQLTLARKGLSSSDCDIKQQASKLKTAEEQLLQAKEDCARKDRHLAKTREEFNRRLKELGDVVLDLKDETDELRRKNTVLEQERKQLLADAARGERSERLVDDTRMDTERIVSRAEDFKKSCDRRTEDMEHSLEMHFREWSQRLLAYSHRMEDLQDIIEAGHSLQNDHDGKAAGRASLQKDLELQVETLQRRNQQLQKALVDAKVLYAILQPNPRQAEQRQATEDKLHAIADARGVSASFATLRQADGAAKSHAAEALKKVERLRSDVLETSEAAEAACARAASVSSENSRIQARAAEAEKTLKAAREELMRLRDALLEARATTVLQVVELAHAGAQEQLPGTGQVDSVVEAYVRVLEYSLKEAEQVATALRSAAKEAHGEEARAREQLEESRAAEKSMRESLQLELKRVHRLETLRLVDLRELHDLERRLGLATQEGNHLRETLAAERHRWESSSWQGAGTTSAGLRASVTEAWESTAMVPSRSESPVSVELSAAASPQPPQRPSATGLDGRPPDGPAKSLQPGLSWQERIEPEGIPEPPSLPSLPRDATPAQALQRARDMASRWAGYSSS